ncbi:MAG: hypothetical protein Q9187_000940 [Circinaria calcarea]
MSISGTLARSMSSSVTSRFGFGSQSLFFTTSSIRIGQRMNKNYRGSSRRAFTSSTNPTLYHMENLFIDALVRAGTCSHHSQGNHSQRLSLRNTIGNLRLRNRLPQPIANYTRAFHGPASDQSQSLAVSQLYSQDDYRQMLDYYHGTSFHETSPIWSLESQSLPNIEAVESEGKAAKRSGAAVQQSASFEYQSTIDRAVSAISDLTTTHEALFESYQALPFPGVSYLPLDARRLLLRRLSVVEKKIERETLRYLSIVGDMKAAEIQLSEGEWNSAIHLAGRCFSKVTATEVEYAIRTWKEMEEEAGVKSSHVTYNILFDIATKAGKFTLAEIILKEMHAQRMEVNRFSQVGLIYYHGLKGDGDGVRRAYRDLVEQGQIVDTVVLNCVIASLLRAGELATADQVYQRMKVMYAKRTGAKLPSNTFKGSRELGKMLNRAAKHFKNDSLKRQKLQDEQSLAPNVHTYVIYLEHHVSQTGELQCIANLLDEMQFLGLPIHGRLFMELFRGFFLHGGIRYTSWTAARLEDVWTSFVQVLGRGIDDVYVGKWIAVWVLRAFIKCCGKRRALEIWNELKSRWKPSEREMEIVHGILEQKRRQ